VFSGQIADEQSESTGCREEIKEDLIATVTQFQPMQSYYMDRPARSGRRGLEGGVAPGTKIL